MKEQNKKANLIILRERGDVIDFNERCESLKATIKRDKAKLEIRNKYNTEDENNCFYVDALIRLIYNLHLIEDGLKGRLDIIVIPEREHNSQMTLEGT